MGGQLLSRSGLADKTNVLPGGGGAVERVKHGIESRQ